MLRFDFTLKHVSEVRIGKVNSGKRNNGGNSRGNCYDLKSLEWDSKTTLVLSNIRELDRVPNTK